MADETTKTSGIELKDRNGNPIFYKRAFQIDVPAYDSDGNPDVWVFARVRSLSAYACKTSSVNGQMLYTPVMKLQFIPTDRVVLFGISDVNCKELGNLQSDGSYVLVEIVTVKNLNIGETYTADQLG